jgi:hypothetical protein
MFKNNNPCWRLLKQNLLLQSLVAQLAIDAENRSDGKEIK